MACRCCAPRISTRSRSSRRKVPTRRSQVAFIRGAWTAVRRILVPAAWNTASNEAVKFRSAVADEEVDVLEPLAGGEGEVAGLLHCPFAGRVGGNAAEVHPAGAVLDEHQDSVECSSVAVHRIHVRRESSLVEATSDLRACAAQIPQNLYVGLGAVEQVGREQVACQDRIGLGAQEL